MAIKEKFLCSGCGKEHEGSILDLSYVAPAYWDAEEAKNNPDKWLLDSDICTIDGVGKFVRGVIEIPIVGLEEVFRWGVWVSLSEEKFSRYISLYNVADVSEEEPYFGWLSNSLPGYPGTLNLKTNIYLQNGGLRPKIVLDHTDSHPLAQDQHSGISMNRVHQILKENNKNS